MSWFLAAIGNNPPAINKLTKQTTNQTVTIRRRASDKLINNKSNEIWNFAENQTFQ